jgi:hypothetical protein
MIIDLSIPRLFINNKIDEVIFNTKMKGHGLNRYQIAGIITAAMLLGCNENVLAYEGANEMDESLGNNIYPVIFAFIDTIKSCTISNFKNFAMYLNNIRK